MGTEMGLALWMMMDNEQQRRYLQKAENKHCQELSRLSYEESLKRTHDLLRLVDFFPIRARQDKPIGLGRLLA